MSESHPIPIEDGLRIKIAHKISEFVFEHNYIKGCGRILKFIPYLVPKRAGKVICPTNYGFNLLVDPTEHIGKYIYLYGVYEVGTLSVMKSCLQPCDNFIDIGANIGLMSIVASKFVGEQGKVYSFEPEPHNFKILKKNLEINKIKNISIYNLALGKQKEKLFIYPDMENWGSASLIMPDKKVEGTLVEVETLNNWVRKHKIDNIKMIKIDVEGWEIDVLEGAADILTSPNAPIICIEYNPFFQAKKKNAKNIYHYIKSLNDYEIYKLKKGLCFPSKLIKIKRFEDLPTAGVDNLFCFLPQHKKFLKPYF